MSEPSYESSLDAVLYGARAIGMAIFPGLAPHRAERRAFHLLQRKLIPATKLGKVYISTKRRLLQRVNGEDGWEMPVKIEEPPPPAKVPRSDKRKLTPRRKAA